MWTCTRMKERSGRNPRSVGDGELDNGLIDCCLEEIPIKIDAVSPKFLVSELLALNGVHYLFEAALDDTFSN